MNNRMLQMWHDCLVGAQNKISIQDYKLFCSRSTKSTMSYPDRMQVLNDLIALEMVKLVDNKLELGNLPSTDLLKSSLVEGDGAAWEIVDMFPRSNWKFDPYDDSLAEIGLKGELALVHRLKNELPSDLHPRILHQSLINDSLGYDISAPSIYKNQETSFLEVKTSTRPTGFFRFHISRNEFDTGAKNPRWFLVLAQLQKDEISFVGHISHNELASIAPKEVENGLTWESCVLSINLSDVTQGLP